MSAAMQLLVNVIHQSTLFGPTAAKIVDTSTGLEYDVTLLRPPSDDMSLINDPGTYSNGNVYDVRKSQVPFEPEFGVDKVKIGTASYLIRTADIDQLGLSYRLDLIRE